jgi:hypothetical protein
VCGHGEGSLLIHPRRGRPSGAIIACGDAQGAPLIGADAEASGASGPQRWLALANLKRRSGQLRR